MAKLLLHYRTTLGPRTIIAEISDAQTASAVMNSHLALGEQASICDESARVNLKARMEAYHRRKEKAALKVIERDPKVTALPLAKAKRAGK